MAALTVPLLRIPSDFGRDAPTGYRSRASACRRAGKVEAAAAKMGGSMRRDFLTSEKGKSRMMGRQDGGVGSSSAKDWSEEVNGDVGRGPFGIAKAGNQNVSTDVEDLEVQDGLSVPLLNGPCGVPRGRPPAPTNWSTVILPFLFPALGGLLFGYDIGATSGAVVSLKDAVLSGTDWFNLSPTATGLIVSGSLGGALLGSGLAYLIADSLGRKKELLLAAMLYALGAAAMAYAPSLDMLLAGRVLYGLAIGAAMHGAPMYIAETAPSEVRGTLISIKEVFIVTGILLGYLSGSVNIDTVGGWRIMYGAAAPVALLMGLGQLTLPESPRWLCLRANQGKGVFSELKAQAAAALRSLRGPDTDEAEIQSQVSETLTMLRHASQADEPGKEKDGGLADLVRGSNLKALLIGTGLVFFQQVTGQPSVLYYAAEILQDAGFSAASDAINVAVILGIFKLGMTGLAVVTVDKWGRRPLLLAGVSGIVVSLLALSATYAAGGALPLLSAGALLLYVGCYQVSFGPISWLMVAEVFPLRVRGKALSIATLVNFGSNALVAFALPSIQSSLGRSGTFMAFGTIGLAALLFVYTIVPETKGLSLEEIEAKLAENKT